MIDPERPLSRYHACHSQIAKACRAHARPLDISSRAKPSRNQSRPPTTLDDRRTRRGTQRPSYPSNLSTLRGERQDPARRPSGAALDIAFEGCPTARIARSLYISQRSTRLELYHSAKVPASAFPCPHSSPTPDTRRIAKDRPLGPLLVQHPPTTVEATDRRALVQLALLRAVAAVVLDLHGERRVQGAAAQEVGRCRRGDLVCLARHRTC